MTNWIMKLLGYKYKIVAGPDFKRNWVSYESFDGNKKIYVSFDDFKYAENKLLEHFNNQKSRKENIKKMKKEGNIFYE